MLFPSRGLWMYSWWSTCSLWYFKRTSSVRIPFGCDYRGTPNRHTTRLVYKRSGSSSQGAAMPLGPRGFLFSAPLSGGWSSPSSLCPRGVSMACTSRSYTCLPDRKKSEVGRVKGHFPCEPLPVHFRRDTFPRGFRLHLIGRNCISSPHLAAWLTGKTGYFQLGSLPPYTKLGFLKYERRDE